jgi:hypothetical protein
VKSKSDLRRGSRLHLRRRRELLTAKEWQHVEVDCELKEVAERENEKKKKKSAVT